MKSLPCIHLGILPLVLGVLAVWLCAKLNRKTLASAAFLHPAGCLRTALALLLLVGSAAYGQIVLPAPGFINTVAGNGVAGYTGDGLLATSAEMENPWSVALDSQGNIYVADISACVVRKVTASTGVITTVAGTGTCGYNSDGILATSAEMYQPNGVAVDSSGNIYISDTYNQRIRKVNVASGLMSTVAGNGTPGYNNDGIAATSAELVFPGGVALDSSGNIYIADMANNRIRKVTISSGLISTVAGNGTQGYNGDGIAATSAELDTPNTVAVDSSGNIYIADAGNNRIRKVTVSSGLISTVAGNGTQGYNGDGIAATSAELYLPAAAAVDSSGNIYIADSGYNFLDGTRIRKVTVSSGLISTVAGTGTVGYNKDGIPANTAEINSPEGVAVDSSGNIYIADSSNSRVRAMGAGTAVGVSCTPTTITSVVTTSCTATIAGNAPTGTVEWQINGSLYQTDTLSGSTDSISDVSSWNLGSIPVGNTGSIAVTALYSGDSKNMAGAGGATVWVTPATPTLTVSSSGSPSVVGASVTLNANLPSDSSGTVTFYNNGTSIGTATASGSSAQLIVSSLPLGSNSITATWVGDTNYTSATSPAFVQVVNNAKTTPKVTVTPSSFTINTTQALSVTVAVSGTPAPTGSVILLGGGYTSTAATLSGGSATINIPASTLAGGSETLTASYTPDATSSVIYNSATGTSSAVTVTVPKTTPTITWAAPAAITYGTALSGRQLNATASVGGSYSYLPALGTVLTAGLQTLKVNFTPTDTTDYTTATGTTTITVNQATPTITWAAPAAITYGTALSSTQLDATASVPGTFAYNPATGTTPPTGADTLSVTFTPTDTADYTTGTATVQLMVNVPHNPAPAISSLSPALASAGGAAFTLSVNGTGFTANSTVNWGATALTTTYVSATKLTAAVTAAEIASAGTSPVTVVTSAPGGGTSNALTFEIDSSDSTATPPSFSVATVAVAAGSPASYTVTLPSSVTAATASCLNLPAGASCSYSAGTVTITTSSTTPAGTYQIIVVFNETVTSSTSAWILLPILLLPLYFTRKRLTRRGAWLSACVVLVLFTATATIIGCGGGGSSTTNQQPPPQTYQVVSSGTVTLTVQ